METVSPSRTSTSREAAVVRMLSPPIPETMGLDGVKAMRSSFIRPSASLDAAGLALSTKQARFSILSPNRPRCW